MHRWNESAWALVVCCAILCAASLREWIRLPDGRMHAWLIDVGQGDALLMRTPHGKHILVDGGPDMAALEFVGSTLPFFNRTIDLMILTHPHADHLTSLPALLARYRVGAVLMTGVAGNTPGYLQMQSLLRAKQIPVWIADPTKDVVLDTDVLLDVLWPPPVLADRRYTGDTNDTSIVAMVRYGTDALLLTGDMEKASEDALYATGEDLSATILKVAHHGSRTSSSTGFLLSVQPSLAAISAGKENSFGHPHPWILQRLESLRIPVQTTIEQGTIDMILGETIR